MTLRTLDLEIIHVFRKLSVPVARIGLFIVFFWFGILKVIGTGLSPATPLVEKLFDATFPISVSFGTFMVLFGLFECLIGILFLIKGVERVVIPLLVLHMITTILPLFCIPGATWSGFLVPTLEGQYIIKNIVIIAAAIGIAAHVHPMKKR
ncbi:MAG: hypothetical protein RL536_6 [Candidatus Parcubacteria bacterium]|jgi:uncharacterized membrane protein YkgB